MTAEEFSTRDMLLALNAKVDEVLRTLATKADAEEVKGLRKRMHDVEGKIAASTWMFDLVSEMKTEIRGLKEQEIRALQQEMEALERTQVTEEAVAKALKLYRDDFMRTMKWAIGLLASLGVINSGINWMQGF